MSKGPRMFLGWVGTFPVAFYAALMTTLWPVQILGVYVVATVILVAYIAVVVPWVFEDDRA